MPQLLLMILEFLKTGLFAVGGGLATIPFLTEMAKNHPDWFTMQQLTDMIAVGESTPGPIGINMATYAGYNAAGIPGAVCVTLALALPSFIVICIISKILTKFATNKYVLGAFAGMRPAVPALIFVAVLPLMKLALLSNGGSGVLGSVNVVALLLFHGIMICFSKFKKIHPLVFIAIGAVAGIIFKM